ncbi:MAG: 5-methyltetrahydropteroyltriglutamate--homocysteine S-methyltransferase, partial [Eubacterium sp.]|nr:5-methyltetrahydropteroyltriglutamate--homocysteine S-methyltransferase [Eubacterium sp.]
MKTSVIGFPRIGKDRELKFASEKYFRSEIGEDILEGVAKEIRQYGLLKQKNVGIDFISSNDFSFYDGVLDTAFLFNVIPDRYKELGLPELGTYFALARGYQGDHGNVKALAMKKWFNTNYHYLVPEIDDTTEVKLVGDKPVREYKEAKAQGVETKPVIVGPFTFLKLAKYTGNKGVDDFKADFIREYKALLEDLKAENVAWVQFDEPYLVRDLSSDDIKLFVEIYQAILAVKGDVKVLLQTYFGDIRDIYETVISLAFDGIGLDFIEGRKTAELVKTFGFPKDKLLFAGLVNGKNIWKNNYAKTIDALKEIKAAVSKDGGDGSNVVLGTSCSLLHVPYTLDSETKLTDDYKKHFAFAEEKLGELADIAKLSDYAEASNVAAVDTFKNNQALFAGRVNSKDEAVQKRVAGIKEADYTRLPAFDEREKLQKEILNLPSFPTTTIGSFPQTSDVRKNRQELKKGLKTKEEYTEFNKKKIKECIELQEEIGLDVLVHGEFERNDMVE